MTETLFRMPFAEPADQEEGLVLAPRFDRDGLVTAVVTDFASGMLLMVAHMDREALALSVSTRIAHYYSRSRKRLWKKGETSGALQAIREIRIDCDQDAVWLRVEVERAEETCHTHRTSCFYRRIDEGDGYPLVLVEHPPHDAH